jgi:hypothetical protein
VTHTAGHIGASGASSGDQGWFRGRAGPDADQRRAWHRFGRNIQLLLEGDRTRTRAWLAAVDERLLGGNEPPETVLDMALEAILAGMPPEDFSAT